MLYIIGWFMFGLCGVFVFGMGVDASHKLIKMAILKHRRAHPYAFHIGTSDPSDPTTYLILNTITALFARHSIEPIDALSMLAQLDIILSQRLSLHRRGPAQFVPTAQQGDA